MLELSTKSPERIRPLRRAEYDRLVELGAFDNERVELLRGAIVEMSPPGARHASVVDALNMLLAPALVGRAVVRVQSPFAALDDSEPQPDLTILPQRGSTPFEHPSEADLVVEVADSSLHYDRTSKVPVYAEAGVPECWIVNLRDEVVEVHTDPAGGAYAGIREHRRGDSIALVAFPDLTVAVDDVLP